jgi:hypothetical protein
MGVILAYEGFDIYYYLDPCFSLAGFVRRLFFRFRKTNGAVVSRISHEFSVDSSSGVRLAACFNQHEHLSRAEIIAKKKSVIAFCLSAHSA